MEQLKVIQAELIFKKYENGGRIQLPEGSGFCPYLRTTAEDMNFAVRLINFPKNAQFEKTTNVKLELLHSDHLDYSILKKGLKITLVEGMKEIAYGVLTSNIKNTPDKLMAL